MMQVKKYVAATFAEALIQAKSELGTDAMIVESKKLRVGGILGFLRREVTELTVAYDQPAGRRPTPRSAAPAGAAQAPAPAQASLAAPPAPPNLAQLEREVAGLRAVVARLADRAGSDTRPPELQGFGRQIFEGLVARGTDEAAALDIGQRVWASGPEGRLMLHQELTRLLEPIKPIEAHPGRRQVVALVGPTGVGKTTTLAKLAARFSLEQGLNVALITSDTFRIAAIDQLRTYADILGVPMYAADTPSDVAAALEETAACDLVLVDTGGRNHKDAARMQDLKELLATISPDETHLVFSLTANPKDAFEALDSYTPLGVNRLTFTKLDEATSPGLMLNLRLRCNQPFSYITNGQSVPEDILPADRVDFTKVLLGA